MTDDRRGTRRFAGPFDARWSGHSGAGTCRITDISDGGCFVETRAAPVAGERVSVQPVFADTRDLHLEGVVVYTVEGLGFAVRFSGGPDELLGLRQVLDRLADRVAGRPHSQER